MTVEELQRQKYEIQAELDKIERAEAEKRGAALVGRCFKYSNSFGSPGERWWLYFKVTGYDWRWVKGVKFQRDCNGRFEVEPDDASFNEMSNWLEIEPDEFERELTTFLAALHLSVGR